VTVGDTRESIDRLVAAFAWLSANRRTVVASGAALRSSGDVIAPGIQAMSPRDAFFAPARTVPLDEAVGQVSAELVIPYPPGIPVLAPGDTIEERKLAYLRQGAAAGMYISGPADPSLRTIQIVAGEASRG
jgi:lysine decarboxylase